MDITLIPPIYDSNWTLTTTSSLIIEQLVNKHGGQFFFIIKIFIIEPVDMGATLKMRNPLGNLYIYAYFLENPHATTPFTLSQRLWTLWATTSGFWSTFRGISDWSKVHSRCISTGRK
jgi:hypothetical protein